MKQPKTVKKKSVPADMLHKLGNLLTSVTLLSEMLLQDQSLASQHKRYLRLILSNSKKIKQLLNSLKRSR